MTSLTPNLLPNTWTLPDEDALPVHDARCDFSPMLQVDIKTGKVLVDRRDEVLPRKQRGGMYGRW
jgi:hypothetical protein